MNFLIYKKLNTLKTMSSVLFIHRCLFHSKHARIRNSSAINQAFYDPKPKPKRQKRIQRVTRYVPLVAPEEKTPDLKSKVTDEQLDEMYEKKFYNSDMWATVIKRQKDKWFAQRRPRQDSMVLAEPNQSVGVLSYAAQSILQESGWWRGELSTEMLEESDKHLRLEDLFVDMPHGKTNYPFQMVKLANEVSEPMQKQFEEGTLIESSYPEPEIEPSSGSEELSITMQEFEETLKELNESVAAESSENDMSLLNPNYVERIELNVPYQQMIYNSEVDRIQKYRMKALYGSANPDIPSTNMPCGGCGAILHCQDSAIPGYLPSEMLENLTVIELQDTICQRCNFLKYYDVALNVSVSPKDYIRVISEIKDKNALVLLLVDLLDFPCSIWPGIIDIVGPNRPLVVVGNKVDLLPKDCTGYLERIKMCLAQSLKDFGVDTGNNIKHLALISAKTGYGVEELITAIQHHWKIKGDIYAIGCTNVGKSSLFNALLQSDLCKIQAADIIHRATISHWPGTTLNLLKFPLLNPTPWRTFLRLKRLQAASNDFIQERALRQERLKETKNPHYATLIGNIGMTYVSTDNQKASVAAAADPFNMSISVIPDLPKIRRKKFKEEDPAFAFGKWFYDTPGAIHHDQIINILTLDELTQVLPKSMIAPRCFVIRPGQTLFLAGLGRIDYVEGEASASLMVFSSSKLPVSVVNTELADEFYQNYLGTEVLKVPFGGWDRLKDFPALKPKEVQFASTSRRECCGDILLSSAGWVSVGFYQVDDTWGTFLAYTPEGRGCYARKPALLKHSIELRGKRIAKTPFCQPSSMIE